MHTLIPGHQAKMPASFIEMIDKLIDDKSHGKCYVINFKNSHYDYETGGVRPYRLTLRVNDTAHYELLTLSNYVFQHEHGELVPCTSFDSVQFSGVIESLLHYSYVDDPYIADAIHANVNELASYYFSDMFTTVSVEESVQTTD
ncbi:hypothetical protein UA32_12055 [Photobacterium angustum]|uniref:DUF2787 domain-containing protein n=1 Tax=Photobacterium angustum TaxID=661 RepID=A0ABX5GZ49_PHOAN|nr:DUF2787 family protein [Photobacterium angustum]KJG37690.1 hypothetical protein UA32_12055 [Photobacterium angustum]PSX03978.1 DUF2787 domain-containing protein [Photobacterium angustum]